MSKTRDLWDEFWILLLGVPAAIALVVMLTAWQGYRECRRYTFGAAWCLAAATHTERLFDVHP